MSAAYGDGDGDGAHWTQDVIRSYVEVDAATADADADPTTEHVIVVGIPLRSPPLPPSGGGAPLSRSERARAEVAEASRCVAAVADIVLRRMREDGASALRMAVAEEIVSLLQVQYRRWRCMPCRLWLCAPQAVVATEARVGWAHDMMLAIRAEADLRTVGDTLWLFRYRPEDGRAEDEELLADLYVLLDEIGVRAE